jgi:hypothetical protein
MTELKLTVAGMACVVLDSTIKDKSVKNHQHPPTWAYLMGGSHRPTLAIRRANIGAAPSPNLPMSVRVVAMPDDLWFLIDMTGVTLSLASEDKVDKQLTIAARSVGPGALTALTAANGEDLGHVIDLSEVDASARLLRPDVPLSAGVACRVRLDRGRLLAGHSNLDEAAKLTFPRVGRERSVASRLELVHESPSPGEPVLLRLVAGGVAHIVQLRQVDNKVPVLATLSSFCDWSQRSGQDPTLDMSDYGPLVPIAPLFNVLGKRAGQVSDTQPDCPVGSVMANFS